MDESLQFEPEDHYPPCNIVRTGEERYRMTLAAAGLKPEQISVAVQQNMLTVTGRVSQPQSENPSICFVASAPGRSSALQSRRYVELKGATFETDCSKSNWSASCRKWLGDFMSANSI
jgi:molecular chaperone IbpA